MIIVAHGCDISPDEIFVSDGSKCDGGNILDIFGPDNVIAVMDPVYPIYVDTNVMAGHTGEADETANTGPGLSPLQPRQTISPRAPPQKKCRSDLSLFPQQSHRRRCHPRRFTRWVDYAADNESLILFDAAYEAYITDASIPHSIYEIPGANDVSHRIPLLLQNGRLHRHALRLHRRPQNRHGQNKEGKKALHARPLASPPHHQIQQRLLHRPARRRGSLFP